MRLYSFCNQYLSSIQQGIQTAHLVSNLFNKYKNSRGMLEYDILFKWADTHKTIIVLNGGTTENIQSIFQDLWLYQDVNLPFDKFHEDDNSLGGIITCCGIVVPEEMYEAKLCNCSCESYISSTGTRPFKKDTPIWKIINTIKSYQLAR
jgi:hypothetical protein